MNRAATGLWLGGGVEREMSFKDRDVHTNFDSYVGEYSCNGMATPGKSVSHSHDCQSNN